MGWGGRTAETTEVSQLEAHSTGQETYEIVQTFENAIMVNSVSIFFTTTLRISHCSCQMRVRVVWTYHFCFFEAPLNIIKLSAERRVFNLFLPSAYVEAKEKKYEMAARQGTAIG